MRRVVGPHCGHLVFNVTKDDIRVRMSAIDEEIWPPGPLKKKNPPDTSKIIPFTKFIRDGGLPLPEIVGPLYDEINKKYGINAKPIFE